jgi:cytochrome c peroxidase
MGCATPKRRWPFRLAVQALAAFLILGGCGSDEDSGELAPVLPDVPYEYENLILPEHFNRLRDRTPQDNRVTNAGATLGRVLFYDKQLSRNNTTACGSCHHQARAFTDGRAKAVGFEGRQTQRNAMTLTNLRYQFTAADFEGHEDHNEGLLEIYGVVFADGFFSDMRAPTLEDLALQPIQDPIELGMSLAELPAKLGHLSYYPPLFSAAFGDAQITTDRIARALAQFLRSIVSFKTKFDEGLAQARSVYNDFPNFTAQENEGKRIFVFQAECEICHAPQYATSLVASNNGLDTESADLGVGALRSLPHPRTGLNRLDGFFKASSLRNVELTAPYMHDGRFATLEQVIDHYNSGIQPHRNLSPILKGFGVDAPPVRLELSPEQKAALVAFLKTLTDRSLVSDQKFSDPFPQ